MANDKKSKKSLTEYLGKNPKAYTPFDVPAIVYTAVKEKKQDKKRKKDKTSLKKNKDMIMGGLKGYRKPSGKKADPNLFTLEELGAMENPSYPLTKKQKTRIYEDPNATYSLKRILKNRGGLTNTVPPKRGPQPQGYKHGGCPHREIGVKSNIKGISGIQLKGQKFTGTK